MRIAVGRKTDECLAGSYWFAGALFLGGILVAFATCVGVSVGWSALRLENGKTLQVYFVDVEGGQATLFVTPEYKSLLIDTGWPDSNGRDADRIVAAAKLAGIKQIDFVLLTHYHMDHAGGLPQLAAQIPIGTVIDHGENREPKEAATAKVWQDYQALLAKGQLKRIVAKAGETLPLEGIGAQVISSDGALIDKPLGGAGGQNVSCSAARKYRPDGTENARSLGVLLTFGKLRILDLGDLTSDKEIELVCPENKLGAMDIYIVSHHGSITSNSPVFLNAIAPRVAIMDNGSAKGGVPSSWDAVKKSPRLEDFWQLHFSDEGGTAHNAAESFIANLAGPDTGNYLKLTAWEDGNFEVFNSRTKQTKHYAPAH
jgi:beta-lactamase superfamily II metal-dependent hydrolase